MAIIKAFKGLRPPKDIVKQLASRPYDVLNSAEARIERLTILVLCYTLQKRKLIFPKELTSIAKKFMIKW